LTSTPDPSLTPWASLLLDAFVLDAFVLEASVPDTVPNEPST